MYKKIYKHHNVTLCLKLPMASELEVSILAMAYTALQGPGTL